MGKGFESEKKRLIEQRMKKRQPPKANNSKRTSYKDAQRSDANVISPLFSCTNIYPFSLSCDPRFVGWSRKCVSLAWNTLHNGAHYPSLCVCLEQLLCSSILIVFRRILWVFPYKYCMQFSTPSKGMTAWRYPTRDRQSNNFYDEVMKKYFHISAISVRGKLPYIYIPYGIISELTITPVNLICFHLNILDIKWKCVELFMHLRVDCLCIFFFFFQAFAWLHSTIFYEFIQFIIFPFVLIVYSLNGYTFGYCLYSVWFFVRLVLLAFSSSNMHLLRFCLPLSLSLSRSLMPSTHFAFARKNYEIKTHSSYNCFWLRAIINFYIGVCVSV